MQVSKEDFVRNILMMKRERMYKRRREHRQNEADRHIQQNFERIRKSMRQMPKMRGVYDDR